MARAARLRRGIIVGEPQDYADLVAVKGDAADRVKDKLEEWLGHLPPAARDQIRQRLASSDRATYLGAFWELYLAEVFRRLEFEVEPDIGLDDRPGRRPDYRMSRGDVALRVEATLILGDDVIHPRERPRLIQFYEALERIRNRDFLVHPAVVKIGPNTPGRRLTVKIDEWLDELDPDELLAGADELPPTTVIDFEGWSVVLEATAKKPDVRDMDIGVVGSKIEGFGSSGSGDGNDEAEIELDTFARVDEIRPLVKGLRAKADHGYELEDEPFIVAVLCAGTLVEDHDIAQALYGEIEYYAGTDGGLFTGGGLWMDRGGKPIHRDVSAVLTAAGLAPDAVTVIEPCLWLNPEARSPLPADHLPWRQLQAAPEGGFKERPAQRASAQILGLDARWPHS